MFIEDIKPRMKDAGIHIVRWSALEEAQKSALHDYFQNQIFPVLTPLAVDPAHPFPYISGLSLNLAVVVRNNDTGKEHFARVKVPPLLPRFVRIPGNTGVADARFVPLEDIIGEFLGLLFPGMQVPLHIFEPRYRALVKDALARDRRIGMIHHSDAVATVSPPAMKSVIDYAEALKCPDIAQKTMVVPHPVSHLMSYHSETKSRKILVVGRWAKEDAPQKDPVRTMEVLHDFLHSMPKWSAEVIGRESDMLAVHTSAWSPSARDRLTFRSFLDHTQLNKCYSTSRILLCASRFESFHIASAEAVCCGCSVVVGKHPLLASTSWFTIHGSGTLAKSRNRKDLGAALCHEAIQWENGQRLPHQIATFWSEKLHASRVAKVLAAWANDSMVKP